MAQKRPVFLPKSAAFFVGLREAKGWKQAQAADIARRRGLDVGYQSLRWIEEGKIKSPEPELLRAVAALYDAPYELIAAMCFEERYGLAVAADLPRHDQKEGSGAGGTGVPASVSASARILELERQLTESNALLRDVRDVASKLFVRLATVGESETADRDVPAASRRPRRAAR